MKRQITSLCLSLLLLGASAPLGAATAWRGDALHTGVWSVYAQGGAVMAGGLAIESVNAPRMTDVSPLFGGGVSFQFAPWVRLNLDYEYGSYTREQRYSSIQSFDKPQLSFPDMVLDELFGGQAYHETWTVFHDASLTADFNILELWQNRVDKRFNLYLGAGVGYGLAIGNSYDISLGHEIWSDPDNYTGSLQVGNSHEIYSWVDVSNTPHDYKAPYIPANLSAEYDITPHFSVGARAMYRYVFSEDPFAPKHLMGAALTLRLNFAGKK